MRFLRFLLPVRRVPREDKCGGERTNAVARIAIVWAVSGIGDRIRVALTNGLIKTLKGEGCAQTTNRKSARGIELNR
jgi:hypothetical protein